MDRAVFDLQDGNRQAIEDIIEEHCLERGTLSNGKETVQNQALRFECIHHAQDIMSGMVGEHAMPPDVMQHAR